MLRAPAMAQAQPLALPALLGQVRFAPRELCQSLPVEPIRPISIFDHTQTPARLYEVITAKDTAVVLNGDLTPFMEAYLRHRLAEQGG